MLFAHLEENGNVSLDSLPEDLRQVVKEDNELFEKELENWNSSKEAGINNNNASSLSYTRKSPNFAVAERGSFCYKTSIAYLYRDSSYSSSYSSD